MKPKFKVGDVVTWNIQNGVNPIARVVKVTMDDGRVRYRVEALQEVTYVGKYGRSTIEKGDQLEPLPYYLKRVKR